MIELAKYSHCEKGQEFLKHLESCPSCQKDIQEGVESLFEKFPMAKLMLKNFKLFREKND